MLSTPKGVGNVFHKTYTDAVEKANDFNPIRVEWWEHPEHISDLSDDPVTGKKTSSWYRKETKGLSEREKAQEYECEFLGSGDTFFSSALIAYARSTEIHHGLEEGLQIYSHPVKGRSYIMSVDSSTGRAVDRCGIEVFDQMTMEQVAELNAIIKPDVIASESMNLGRRYNNALMVVENNAVGLAVIEHIKLARYPNFFYSKKGAKAGDRLGEAGQADEGAMSDDFIHGVTTHGFNRIFMLNKLEELIRNKQMTIRSSRFVDEMTTFVWNGDKPQARGGKRDDLIMSVALLVWIRDNLFGGVYSSQELVDAMVRSIMVNRMTNVQIQGASKNPDLVPSRFMGSFGQPSSPYTMRLPDGKHIDVAREMGMNCFIPMKG
jgi:hypothetical protein